MATAALYKIQAADEATRGTALAATAKWYNTLRPRRGDRTIVQPDEARGSLAGPFRNYVAARRAILGDLGGDVTFEDFILAAGMALVAVTTPTQPDATSNPNVRRWTYSPSLTASQNPLTFTVEFGDDTAVYEAEYVFATALKVAGAIDGVWQLTAPLVGRQITTTSFTGALGERTVESCATNLMKVYFDDTGGTIGTTQISGAVVDFEWELPAHFVHKTYADGNLYFTVHEEVKMAPTLHLTMKVTSAVKTLIDTKYEAQTRQLARLQGNGAVISGAYSKYINIDSSYVILDVGEFGESDGASVVEVDLGFEYDSGLAKAVGIEVQNAVTAIP